MSDVAGQIAENARRLHSEWEIAQADWRDPSATRFYSTNWSLLEREADVVSRSSEALESAVERARRVVRR